MTRLLNPLTQNEFVLKDSFVAADRIREIPSNLFNDRYKLVSFDVTSLFTNVPLTRTINVILKIIYNDKLISTSIKKNTMRKLLRDTCTKTDFMFNGNVYKQIDGVSMGASLGPVLANVIMTELEKVCVQKLIDDGTIKFYARYVDDTLMMVKPESIDKVHKEFEKFDQNLKFTVDKFENEVPRFLDIEIAPDGLSIYSKPTQTGQYIHYSSNTPWRFKTSWISALVHRAKQICSPNKLPKQLDQIRNYVAWNGFPKHIGNKIIKDTISRQPRNACNLHKDDKTSIIYILIYRI